MGLLKRLLIIMLIFIGLSGAVYAADTDWAVHIKVSVPDSRTADGMVWNHLIAGVHEGATDGFDSVWDTLSMVEADDPVQAMLIHGTIPEDKNNDGTLDNWSCDTPEDGYDNYNCSLWRDLRSFDAEKVWRFLVMSPVNGGTITLQWSFDRQPDNVDIFLVDLLDSSNIIDMKNTSIYNYTVNFETGKRYGIRNFEIRMKTKGLFITVPFLPDATVDTPYVRKISATGGSPVWSLEVGDLPPMMFINTYTGEVAGTPTLTGSYTFSIRGDDPVTGYMSSREYTLNINPAPKIDNLSLPDGVAGKDYYGQVTATGGTKPIIWGVKGNLPEGLRFDTSDGVISGTLIVPGIYDLTVIIQDANGATDSGNLRMTVIEPDDKRPPDAIRDIKGAYIADTSLLLMWSAPYDDNKTRTAALYDLRYLEDCTAEGGFIWDSAVEASGEPRPQAGAIQTYTLTGLKAGKRYCIGIKSMDAMGHISPISNILITSPDMNIAGLSESASFLSLQKGYNLISFPLIPIPNGRDSLFGPSLGVTVSLYRWYSAYPDITPPQYYVEDVVMPGLGYFLYSGDNVSIDISGLRIDESEYHVLLQNGWNMIGTPYDKQVLMRDINVKKSNTGEVRSYIDAVKAGWIGNTAYSLKSGNYDFASFNDDPPAGLEPWVGYWIYVGAENGVDVIFQETIH